MKTLQAIAMILALLGQVVPLQAWESSTPVCAMACCAAAGTACHCSEAPSAPAQPTPAQTPPAKGRDLAPQVWMTAAFAELALPVTEATESCSSRALATHCVHALPKTRLSVLFCSFLH